jgi:hypothetical protein
VVAVASEEGLEVVLFEVAVEVTIKTLSIKVELVGIASR